MNEPVKVWQVVLFDGAMPCTCNKQGTLDMLEAELENTAPVDVRVTSGATMTQAEYDAMPEWEGP